MLLVLPHRQAKSSMLARQYPCLKTTASSDTCVEKCQALGHAENSRPHLKLEYQEPAWYTLRLTVLNSDTNLILLKPSRRRHITRKSSIGIKVVIHTSIGRILDILLAQQAVYNCSLYTNCLVEHLLQGRAKKDCHFYCLAMKRGDHVYSFAGVSAKDKNFIC